MAAELPSTWTVTRQIVREHGLGFQGLNKGLTATIARNGIFNMVYFGFYHSVKGVVPEYQVSINQTPSFVKVKYYYVYLLTIECINKYKHNISTLYIISKIISLDGMKIDFLCK